METFPEIIHLNVGGKHLTIRLSTLTKYQDSMLAAMFSGRHVIDKDADGRFFIDCNGDIFELILDFLRFGSLPTKEKSLVAYEMAAYFVIQPLMQALESFQGVRNKIKVDKFKSSAAAKEYESLKQKIVAALDSSRPLDTKRILLKGFRNCFQGCTYAPISAMQSKYPHVDVMLEFNIEFEPSEDFIFCLKEDLCKFGFGSYCQAYIDHLQCDRCCRNGTLITIILSSHRLVSSAQKQLMFV